MNYYLLHTTYPILLLSVFARQLCLPVPAFLFLLSGGALAGTGRLSFTGILLVAIIGCLLGDLVWFEAGRLRGKRVLKLLCAFAADPSYCIRRSRTTFAERGLRVLLFAKFVPGLDGIMPPLAGMSGTPRTQFLVFDAGGSALWAGVYIGAGFFCAAELDKVAGYISTFADALVLILGIPLVFFFVDKLIRLLKMIRELRPLHITPTELKARMDAGARIGVLDLLRFEDDPESSCAIPGAVRADPSRMRHKTRTVVPKGVDLVLYCNSKNDFVTARVAASMRKTGVP
jgi:membrane protein DedA with SNARE-associated domain